MAIMICTAVLRGSLGLYISMEAPFPQLQTTDLSSNAALGDPKE